jgi:CHAT domain-containing protein/Tfp pilus assembly protein PilF
MKSFRSITSFCVVLLIALSAHGQNSISALERRFQLQQGLVVERVAQNTPAQKAGVHPGDILLGWKRASTHGEFESPFDLAYVFLEQAPRGPISVVALRGGHRIEWIFRSDAWGISVRPNFTEPLLSIYLQGEELFASGKHPEATEHFRVAAASVREGDPLWLSPWLLSNAGKLLMGARQWQLSDAVYQEAIARAAGSGPVVRAELLRQQAVAYEQRQDLVTATKYYQEVLQECRELGRKTLVESNALLSLAVVELKRGVYDGAEEHLRSAMEIDEALAPTSIQSLLAMTNLAVLYQDQGQFERAEEHYLKALGKEERYFPRSSLLEGTLDDLAVLFDQQGDLARAEAYHRRALAVAERLDPDSLDVADILANLAECIVEQGRGSQAEVFQRRALSIREKASPDSLPTAYSLAGLGKIARIRGNLRKAEEYYRRSLAIADKVDAPGRDRASFFIGLAAVFREQLDFSGAEHLYRQALAIIENEDPGSADRVTTLANLAGTVYQQNRLDAAAQLYHQALNTLENRAFHLGGVQETRSLYRAEHARYYQEYISLLIAQGHPEQAFEVIEGSRARTLFEMLAHANVDVEQGADPVLRERERKLRQMLNAKAEYRIRIVAEDHTDQQTAVVDKEIENLLLEQQEVEAQLRTISPAYASLTEPQKLDVPEIQKLLDSNTLLLEYSLGEERSYVWAVSDNSLKLYALPKRAEIEAAARRVYDLLTSRNRPVNKTAEDENPTEKRFMQAAKKLSEMVIGPVARLLPGKRLLIVSDGALQYIPFSALPTPGSRTDEVPLIVNHEIVNLPSASVLAELRRQEIGRGKAPKTVAVLADPVFDSRDERLAKRTLQEASSSASLPHPRSDLTRSAEDVGLTRGGKLYLSRLVYTRNEADAVMAVIPPGQGKLALDFEASRQMATSPALAKYHIVHFATHGILDNKHPELSGLVLSLVNKEGRPQDGFLKLQDIYNMKLPVDLVVLSGCETGLGEQVNGEGLLSLTRGFMYAGASRVVASLWNVSDIATASLMADFYKAMERDGIPPAAALRVAQIKMWKQKQWSSPYYWAAFQIQGEWK